MGLLVKGEWRDEWYDTDATGGSFKRQDSQSRNWITRDGSAGPSGEGGFRAEPGRYHLYVSLACPWAHRTLIMRKLKRLENIISFDVVHWLMLENGWEFRTEDGATGDRLYGLDYLYQLYARNDPEYVGRVTVPVLWDKQQQRIVSNESSEIIRMLNSAFDEWGDSSLDFYPDDLRIGIDEINATIYSNINNGVYKAGFATSPEAYEDAFQKLFETLNMVEERLSRRRYLMGDRLTEADWRLFTTLVRFDPVYVGHFKCNLRRIADYPNLSNYLRDLYQVDGIAETVDMHHIKSHYYGSHKTINPTGIVPVGPEIDYSTPHDRENLA